MTGYTVAPLQKKNELDQRRLLFCSGRHLVKVPHQTNADSIFIGPITRRSAMSPGFLLAPAEGDFNVSIPTVRAIAYNKVIPNTLPVISLAMPPVKNSHVPIGRTRVMNNDRLPLLLPGWVGYPRGRYMPFDPRAF